MLRRLKSKIQLIILALLYTTTKLIPQEQTIIMNLVSLQILQSVCQILEKKNVCVTLILKVDVINFELISVERTFTLELYSTLLEKAYLPFLLKFISLRLIKKIR